MFEEFKKYVYEEIDQAPEYPANWLLPVKESDIIAVEEKLGFQIPPQLKQFYQEIGFGGINTSIDGKVPAPRSNMIVDPGRLADLYLREDYEWLAEEICDEGEMPFFDIGDQLYLVMKPHSDKPNAVYWSGETTPIITSFREFMIQLHKNPRFYAKLT